jgi:hypothetical protein
MMSKSRFICCAFLCALSSPAAYPAPVDAFFVVQVDIPDEIAIARWCNQLKTSKTEFTSPEGTRLVGAGLQQCDSFHRGKISGQQWADKLIQLKREASPQSVLKVELRDFPDIRVLPLNYPSYALILFPDDSWKTNKNLPTLRATFAKFGDAIGEQGAAIWFIDRGNNIDVERAQSYSDKFGLSRSDGPYILVSRKRPDTITDKRDVIVIKCAGIEADRLANVLEVLEADLRGRREIRKRELLFAEVKQWLLSEGERHDLSAFGITIDLVKQLAK